MPLMKRLLALGSFRTSLMALRATSVIAATLTPALAMACPEAARRAACASACSTHATEYVSAIGFGLVAGIGSAALEAWLKSRR